MKLTIIIMTLFLVQVSASSRAQITIREKNTTLQKVLEVISTQSGYDFVYSNTDFRDLKPISITLNNVTVEEALRAAFSGQPLIYEVSDKTVMVKRKEEKGFIDRVMERLNSISVGGRVIDETGMGLSGVTVSLKGGKSLATTDALGGYSIKNVDENAILVFSYVGYTKKEVPIEGKEMINVRMELSTSKLDEVQVIFGGATSRRISTAGITTITKDDIKNQPINNPLLALQGRVPGLVISPESGVPGAEMKVQLRGQNSLFGRPSEPLFVINGVPITNNIYATGGAHNDLMSSLSFLNPNDIESIDVLKDADATAIYGSRGASGVIVITTKKGKLGTAQLNVNASTNIGQVANKLDLMNTKQYLEMRKEAFRNQGIDFNVAPYNTDEYKFQVAPDLFLWDQNKYTDWQEKILGGTARNHQLQANISGGSDLLQYMIGGSYNRQSYVFPGDGKDENAGTYINLMGRSANQKLMLNLLGNITFNRNVSSPGGTGFALAPNAPDLYNANGELNWAPNPLSGVATWENPYASINNPTEGKMLSMNQSLSASYQFSSSLSVKGTIGYSQNKGNSFSPVPITTKDPATWSYALRQSTFAKSNASSFVAEPQIFYKKTVFAGVLDVMLGGSYQSQTNGRENMTGYGFSSDALLENMGSATGFFGYNNSSEYKYLGGYARVSYNWKDKYLFNLNGRRDGSSRFGPENKFGNFGSVAGAWVFSNEEWMEKLANVLSYGKLRASYGITGNDAIGDYKYLAFYNNMDNTEYQGLKPIASEGLNNPAFHWESVKKLELGIDLGFLKDRLLLSAAYYRNRGDNQLSGFSFAATAGLGGILINQPYLIQNSGLEISLQIHNISQKEFDWKSSFNLSVPRNKLLAIAEVTGVPPLTQLKIGEPFSGVFYGYETVGVDPNTGLFQFLDAGGNVVSSDGGAYLLASSTYVAPRFFGGVQNSFRYKKLSLEFFFQFSKQRGRNIAGTGGAFSTPGIFNSNQPVDLENRWRQPGDNADYMKVLPYNSNDAVFFANSQRLIVDASFIRLKNVAFSYQIFDNQNGGKIKNLSVNVQGQNLVTFTDYNGFDPEMATSAALPQLRTVSLGLVIGL